MLQQPMITLYLPLLLCLSMPAYAQEEAPPESEDSPSEAPKDPEASVEEETLMVKEVLITHTPKNKKQIGGSVHVVDEDLLETFEYDNPESVLKQAPGVYIRSEDGFGLRPNIGLRGANSERSKKVTLMEDGLLFAPAPYSAPAAYYFPMMQRVVSVEVFKGPGTIVFGPNTIGGAINLVTRPIPEAYEGMVDVSYGNTHYTKAHSYYGGSTDKAGFLAEGVLVQSNGFKELDGGGDTGFIKSEVAVQGMIRNGRAKKVLHRGDIKLGFTHEISNETYLGLSDEDFAENPYRRYKASQKDRMENTRYQAVAGYTFGGEKSDVKLRAYHHGFTRAWDKINGFGGASAPSLPEILKDPSSGQRSLYYDILRGVEDSTGASDSIILGRNAREFWVQGLDGLASNRFTSGPVSHELRLGSRLHHDKIHRDHTEKAYQMTAGVLENDGNEKAQTADTVADSLALAHYLTYEASGWGLTVTPGARHEIIWQSFTDRVSETEKDTTQQVLLMGLGTHYAITDEVGILGGIHQGFSPVAPGQDDVVQPEKSINYEGGVRYLKSGSKSIVEVIGFLNQYSNMVAQCSFSVGCDAADLDKQFNGGKVDVHGIETVLGHRFNLPAGLSLPTRLTYTWTQTAFQTAFQSDNPQLGEVEKGDELPYVPEHQGSARIGVGSYDWSTDVGFTFTDQMREEAGQSNEERFTDALFHLDAAARYSPTDSVDIYLRGENLLNQAAVGSRRPYGARPGKPLLVMGGARLYF